MSIDLLLDQNGDLALDEFDLRLTLPTQYVAQRIKQKLKFFKGEWFLNNNDGIPYFEEIFIKGQDESKVRAIFIRAISEINEVKEIISFDMQLDKTTRNLKIDIVIKDNANNIINVSQWVV